MMTTASGDLKVTVFHNDLEFLVDLRRDDEVTLSQVHIVGALISTLSFWLETILRGNLDALRCGIGEAGDGLLLAVISHGLGVAGDGNGDLVGDGGDFQRALSLGDGVVAVFELFTLGESDGVGDRTDVSDRAGGLDVSDLAINETAGNGDLRLRQSGAVVNLAVAGGSQGDLALGDGLGTVGDHEGDLGEVRVLVLEVLRLQAHRIGASIGALGQSGAAESEVVFGIAIVTSLNGVAGYALFGAVVRHGAGVALDSDGDHIGDLNGLPLCIEVIAAVRIRTSIVAFFELDLLLTRFGAPAGELVTSAVREIECTIIGNGEFAVVGHGFGCIRGIRTTKIAVIGDSDRFGLITVDGVEGHVAGDLDAAVGVILIATCILPVQEDLVSGELV